MIIDTNSSTLSQKLESLNWLMVCLILILIFIGFLMLYSAGGASFKPWLIRQVIFFTIFFPVMILIAIADIRIWYNLSYPIYAFGILLLLVVAISGYNAMGATRWFRIGGFNVQPSEIMKICTVIALSRYFYNLEIENIGKFRYLITPITLIALPAALIFQQPDLGTSLILITTGAIVMFLAGVRLWKFIVTGLSFLIMIPLAWIFLLYDYQKQRVLTFLNPDRDPLGAGYNIIQSKIAVGSGGFAGKGYLKGTQGQLNFLPEKQTDFIFTMLSEELGFLGSLTTIMIYLFISILGILISLRTKHQFGKLIAIGITSIFFLHMFINIAMTLGLIPVVGAPLPFISYGGTMMASMMIGFGFILNVDINRGIDLKS